MEDVGAMEEKEWSKGVGEDGRCVRYGGKGMELRSRRRWKMCEIWKKRNAQWGEGEGGR